MSIFSTAASTSQQHGKVSGPQAPGPELDSDQGGAYGWHKAMAVGTRFTDGLIHIELSGASTSPLTIISVTPLMDDGPALRVLGIRVRAIPEMLAKNSEFGWFEFVYGFPPKEPYTTGGVAPEGFPVPPTNGDDTKSVEIQVGYEVVAAGVANRTGVEVIYDYEGIRKRVTIPSHLTICAPADAPCKAQE